MNDVSPIDFANGKIGSKIRNPLIATVLFKNGLIDAFGTGFDRTFKVCAENNVDYEYHNDEFGFTFKFRRGNLSYQNDTKNDMLKPVDRQIIEIMSDNAYVTIPEISKAIGVSIPTVNRHIKELANSDRIKRIGSRKTGYWKVK